MDNVEQWCQNVRGVIESFHQIQSPHSIPQPTAATPQWLGLAPRDWVSATTESKVGESRADDVRDRRGTGSGE